MFRKIFIVTVICFLIVLGAVFLWPQPAPVSPLPTPPPTTFTPVFSPIPSPISASPQVTQPITVSIVSVPQGAKISVNNQVIGNAPLRYSFQTQTQYHITAEKESFVPLALDYIPSEPSLRLPLVALNTLPTFTAIPGSSSPTPYLPSAVPVAFPQAYSLNNHSLPTQEFIYTSTPTTVPTITATATSSMSVPTILATPTTSNNATQPSEVEIQQYQDIINRYTGVYATDPNDTDEQGMSAEHVIIISDRHFYPSPVEVFVAFKPRFVNITTTTCTLKALTEQNTIINIGTLAPNQDLLFHPSLDLNGTWQFWCQERPTIQSTIQFFS